MKEIKAIIQPAMLSKVIEALKTLPDLPGVTVSEVKGFGKSQAADATQRFVEDAIEYSKKVKLEIVVAEGRVEMNKLLITSIPSEERAKQSSSSASTGILKASSPLGINPGYMPRQHFRPFALRE